MGQELGQDSDDGQKWANSVSAVQSAALTHVLPCACPARATAQSGPALPPNAALHSWSVSNAHPSRLCLSFGTLAAFNFTVGIAALLPKYQGLYFAATHANASASACEVVVVVVLVGFRNCNNGFSGR